jgi:hypothetical protein
VSSLLIEPLTFTGVSAVAMAFQMFLTVPAMYTLVDGSGVSLSFREWSNAIKQFDKQNLSKEIEEASKVENPIDQLLKLVTAPNSCSVKQMKDNEAEDTSVEERSSTASATINDAWKDEPISSILTTEELVAATPSLSLKRNNKTTAMMLYGAGLLVLFGYSIAIYLKAATFWEKPLGFVTMAAVLVYDGSMLLVSGNSSARETALNIFVMTMYRVVLVLGGTKYWFLGHTLCYLLSGFLFAKLLSQRLIPSTDPDQKQAQKVDDLLVTVEEAFLAEQKNTDDNNSNSTSARTPSDTACTACTAWAASRKQGKRMVAFVFITLAYSAEIIGAGVAGLPEYQGLQQYQWGVSGLLTVLFVLMSLLSYNQYANVLRVFLAHVLALSPKELQRQQNIARSNQETEQKHLARLNAQNGNEVEETTTTGVKLEEVSLGKENDAPATTTAQSCCAKLAATTKGGMTSHQAFRFWCLPKNNNGSVLFWVLSAVAWILLVALGTYLTMVTSYTTTPLILALGLPPYQFLFAISYTRWHKVNDFEMDWIVGCWSMGTITLLLLLSIIVYAMESVQNQALGFTIGAGILTLTLTFLSFTNWFNTFEYSRTLIFTSLLSGIVLVVWAVLYWMFVLSSAIDMSALVVLFIVVGYSTLALLVLAMWMLKDNEYSFTKTILVLFSISLTLVFVFFAAVCWVDVMLGLVLFSLFTLLLSSVVLVGLWMRNNFVATSAHKLCFISAVLVLGGLGVGAGYEKSSFIIGFTLFWGSIVLLSSGYFLYTVLGPTKKSWTAPHYSQDNVFCYPTYQMDRATSTLLSANGPTLGKDKYSIGHSLIFHSHSFFFFFTFDFLIVFL